MKRVGIVGMGLIGGSMARALAAHGVDLSLDDVHDTTRHEVDQARLGTVAPWRQWIGHVDGVVLAVPTAQVPGLIRTLVPQMRRGATLVDVSSVKAPVAEALAWASRSVCVLALHIMAGREVNGFSASDSQLFQNRPLAVVDIGAGFPDLPSVVWWQERLETLPATFWNLNDHDRTIAWVSQLPYLASRAVRTVVEQQLGPRPLLAGPGYQDTTRVGSSPWEPLWPMLTANQRDLGQALSALEGLLAEWRLAVVATQKAGI